MHDTVHEYRVVAAAVERYQAEVLAANIPLPQGTQPHPLASAVDGLEGTYLIRLWAVFETAWTSYWRYATNRPDGRIRASVSIGEARTRLSTHLARLPDQWPSVGDDE